MRAQKIVAFGKTVGLDIRTTLPNSSKTDGIDEIFLKRFKRDYVCFANQKDAKTVVACLSI